jgi:hypothetical protein
MSKKQDRVSALISLYEALGAVEHDAENQTVELIKENMGNFRECVKKVLALDGVGFMLADSKVGE